MNSYLRAAGFKNLRIIYPNASLSDSGLTKIILDYHEAGYIEIRNPLLHFSPYIIIGLAFSSQTKEMQKQIEKVSHEFMKEMKTLHICFA